MDGKKNVYALFFPARKRGGQGDIEQRKKDNKKLCYYLIYRRKTEAIVTRHFSTEIDLIASTVSVSSTPYVKTRKKFVTQT